LNRQCSVSKLADKSAKTKFGFVAATAREASKELYYLIFSEWGVSVKNFIIFGVFSKNVQHARIQGRE
jgi:hypothetical protein